MIEIDLYVPVCPPPKLLQYLFFLSVKETVWCSEEQEGHGFRDLPEDHGRPEADLGKEVSQRVMSFCSHQLIHPLCLPRDCTAKQTGTMWRRKVGEGRKSFFPLQIIFIFFTDSQLFWKNNFWSLQSSMNHRGISSNMSPFRAGAPMTVLWQNSGPHRNLHWQLTFCVTTVSQFSVVCKSF